MAEKSRLLYPSTDNNEDEWACYSFPTDRKELVPKFRILITLSHRSLTDGPNTNTTSRDF